MRIYTSISHRSKSFRCFQPWKERIWNMNWLEYGFHERFSIWVHRRRELIRFRCGKGRKLDGWKRGMATQLLWAKWRGRIHQKNFRYFTRRLKKKLHGDLPIEEWRGKRNKTWKTPAAFMIYRLIHLYLFLFFSQRTYDRYKSKPQRNFC